MKKFLLPIIIVVGLAGCSAEGPQETRADLFAKTALEMSSRAVGLYEGALQLATGREERERLKSKLGRFLFQRGRFGEAVEVLRGLPGEETQRLFAQCLFKSGDVTGALEVFNRVGEAGPPDYLFAYGQTLEEANLYDQALRVYAKITEEPGLGPLARQRVAAINLRSGGERYAGVSDEVRRLVEESPSQEAYPEASALILLVDEKITLTADNRLESAAHSVVKILNDRGKDAFGEVSLTYDATYEKLDVLYARTIRPDGTVVEVGDKNIRDVSLYLNFPMYSNARVRLLSMPEVAAGSVIEYAFRVTRAQLADKKNFHTIYWLQSNEPILLQRCVINIPADRTLRTKIANAAYNTFGYDLTPRVEEEEDRRTYHLEFRDVPQIIPEENMPPPPWVNPYVLFSTYSDWEEIYRWWRGLYLDKLAVDAAIKEKVVALIKGKKTPHEKARAIYNFCAEEIRYVAVAYGDAGYEPHQATEVFANKYGDCKDQAILLVAMLREAGIEAYPVLISTWDSMTTQTDMPSLLFNHAIAALPLDGKLVFLDPTASVVSFGDLPTMDQGRTTMVFTPDRYQFVDTPVFEPSFNSTESRLVIRVHADESIDAERSVDTRGSYRQAQRYWLKYTMPILIEEGLRQRVREFADQAELKDYEISGVEDLDAAVGLSYTFSAPKYFVEAGPIRILNKFDHWDTSGVFKEKRRYPIASPSLDQHTDRIEVALPDHLAVKYVPPDVEVTTPWFDFSQRYETRRGGLSLTSVRRAKVREIPVAEYPAYKRKVEEIASAVNQHVVLEEVGGSDARQEEKP